MTLNRTRLLGALTIIAAILALVGYERLDNTREGATAAQQDLMRCKEYLAEMGHIDVAPASNSEGPGANPEINLRIHEAAAAAEVDKKLTEVAPGDPQPVPNTDFSELLVTINFETLTMRDLITFLHRLRSADAGARTKLVRLTPPPGQPSGVDREPAAGEEPENWAAEVVVSYLLRAAQGPARR